MNCAACAKPNPDSARFCMQCGATLQAACPHCSAPLPTGAAFCPACGKRVSAGATAVPPQPPALQRYIPAELLAKLEYARTHGGMRGERRNVTILFCDVKGSTAAAEKLDPEEWAEVMNGGFECLIGPVFRYEGTLARLMGDAILAFFGAPIAHEDDPQRAILAALDILQEIEPYRAKVRERWGVDFNVRAGINTGLVVVGEVGSDLRMEYTALGDAVNLAARMEQTAEPGTIQVTGATHRLVAPLFDFEPLGPVEVKGRAEPVETYRVLRARSSPGQVRGLVGLNAPLIGRQAEFDALLRVIDDLRSGRGQIVSVIGEAGVGKSRLITELKREVLARDEAAAADDQRRTNGMAYAGRIAWHEGRSLSYETSTPYAPFIDLLGDCFGLEQGLGRQGRYARLRERVAHLLPERVLDVAPFLGSMLQLPLEGEDLDRVNYLAAPVLREQVFRSACEFLGALAATRPVVLVFEDVHWIDTASLELLQHLLPVTEQSALLVLVAFRPHRQDASWRLHEMAQREHQHRYTSLQLEPLGADDTRVLVNTLLHIEGLSEGVRDLILRKSEGNPFFVEEVIRSLIDSGSVARADGVWRATREITDLAVPDTIAGVITARLDRLNEDARPVLQTASVVGREFRHDVLTEAHEAPAAIDPALIDLQRRGLIRETARVPARLYMFKHALTQETAYSTLLLSRRRELHRKVAGFYERRDPARAEEIARHYCEARAFDEAVPWLVEAGERATRAYSIDDAIGYFTRALEHIETVPGTDLARRAFEGLAAAVIFSFDPVKAMDVYTRMLTFAEARNDLPMQVSALNKAGICSAMYMAQLPEAERFLARAEVLARQCEDYSGLIELHMAHCFINVTTGRFATAMDHLTESAQIGKDLEIGPARLIALAHISSTLVLMRRFDDARAAAEEGRELALRIGHREHLADLLSFPIAAIQCRDGDLDAALRTAEEADRIAVTIRAIRVEAESSLTCGTICQARGDYESAISWFEKGTVAAKQTGFYFAESVMLGALAAVLIEISSANRSKAQELMDRALFLLRAPLGAGYNASVRLDLGNCMLRLGDLERAEEHFENGITFPSATMYYFEPLLLGGKASVALGHGRVDQAAGLIDKALGVVSEFGMKNFAPPLELIAGRVHAAAGRQPEALGYLDRSAEGARRMGLRPVLWQARAEASKSLLAAGRKSEAEAALGEARQVIAEIAGRFRDQELRRQFVEATTHV